MLTRSPERNFYPMGNTGILKSEKYTHNFYCIYTEEIDIHFWNFEPQKRIE